MIPGPELDSTAKSYEWRKLHEKFVVGYIFFNYPWRRKDKYLGHKSSNKKKLTLTDCPKYQIACRLYKCSFGKRTKKINMNNRRCLSYLTCRLKLFPVHFLLPASLINTCFNERAQDVFVRVTAVFLDRFLNDMSILNAARAELSLLFMQFPFYCQICNIL